MAVEAYASERFAPSAPARSWLRSLAPLVRVPGLRGRVARALALLAVVPVVGLLVAQTAAQRVDEALFSAINGLGPGPELVWTILDPHTRNYVVLILAAAALAAVVRRTRVLTVVARVLGAAFVSWGLLESVYAVYDRERPEEVVGSVGLNGHSWADLNSFPSGHMAITAALAVSIGLVFPRLRRVLWAYVAAVALTRVLFGAHFPGDVVAGTALGTASALLVAGAFERLAPARAAADEPRPGRAPLVRARVVAVMPSYEDVPERALVEGVLEQVGSLVIVDDGSSETVARSLDTVAAETGASVVRLAQNGGKGSAVRAGIEQALARGGFDAILVLDADGQHPASAIPGFLAAGAEAELVIGDRFGDLGRMPLQRRVANRFTRRLAQLVTGHEVGDTQNGMRLLRPAALQTLPPGGYEAETRHLRRALRDGLRVAWVPIPAIYADEHSSFRPRDAAHVLWALLGPDAATPSRGQRALGAAFRLPRRSRTALARTRATTPRARPARAATA
jgi:membrane-associated phospholipid phosphatase